MFIIILIIISEKKFKIEGKFLSDKYLSDTRNKICNFHPTHCALWPCTWFARVQCFKKNFPLDNDINIQIFPKIAFYEFGYKFAQNGVLEFIVLRKEKM